MSNPRNRHSGEASAASINASSQEMTTVTMENAQSSGTTRPLQDRSRGDEDEADRLSFSLHVIKIIALTVIALCVCTGLVLSKVSLVSITGRMFKLSKHQEEYTLPRSVLFIQLTLFLMIPEVVSFITCLVRGVIGKTTKNFPWPNRWAFLGGVATSIVEVLALCGFIFGVACKLPPSITILLLNGCFCFPIGSYLVYQTFNRNRDNQTQTNNGYRNLEAPEHEMLETLHDHEQQLQKGYLKHLHTILELLGFLMQLGALVGIPIFLSEKKYFSPSGKIEYRIVFTYILIPVSLSAISIVWSGWIQNKIMKSSRNDKYTARLKTGLINSAIKIILIPFVSYGYAVLLLDLKVEFHGRSFEWHDLELSTFLTHVIVSFITYLFAWIACALHSWAFSLPMLLSTPISFIWYVCGVKIHDHEFFPFIDEYFVDWNLNYLVFIVASLLWVSQFLSFGYHIFQKSDNVLTRDSDLFWTPRYSSVFLEQQLILNRKTAISGSTVESNKKFYEQTFSKNNFIFICSTMYHENEEEMKQMLQSIARIASPEIHRNRENTFESHIFFDDACSGEQLKQYPLQLLGLLNVKGDKDLKIITPYGIQLRYTLQGKMPLYIHLKDNNKVKNKKRWSQVMYMSYVLNYRIKSFNSEGYLEKEKISKHKAFILTTDADIKFTSGSVLALLDILARDEKVGAVCARTHPLGSGPVVWYQIFDYAIGHWLQKAAEHILGCVLCCPGCFSVFRVSALEEVLETYSSDVKNGFDFLTKDMGEDRWLCTLLIEKGWRLEYSAVSQDSTHCPDSFEEFYKQRRRWIPSTIANLALVIGSWNQITSHNNSISIMFILYQLLIVFSSVISPATVILIIAAGLKALDHDINDFAVIIVLSIISVLYGVICIYATEKTQLGIGKILTVVFSIVMAMVFSGIISDFIKYIVGLVDNDDEMEYTNQTSHYYQFPVGVTFVVYTGVIGVSYIVAGILHFSELFYLLHFIWYLLGLPSGYLFLMIYSVCNINNRSWGTREGTRPKQTKNSENWLDYFLEKWYHFLDFLKKWIRKKPRPSQATQTQTTQTSFSDSDPTEDFMAEHGGTLDEDVKVWLQKHKCYERYAKDFEREGYTKMDFIATMKMEDFEAIGIKKRGFLLKLEKQVKKIHSTQFETNVPDSVSKWLKSLKLEEHEGLFESEGYFSDEDVENLKGLTKEDLQNMGIKKRAHLNQLTTGLRYLQYPTDIDIRINNTRAIMDNAMKLKLDEVEDMNGTTNKLENKFWDKLAKTKLQPESDNLNKVEELKEKLRDLRNLSVLILFLINVMWIVFLYALVIPQLAKYNLPDKAFSLLFLALFSIIVLIQFLAMIFHRFETLLHLLAGIRSRDNTVSQWTGTSDVVDVSYQQTTL